METVQELTTRAMEGMDFNTALRERLRIIKPTKDGVNELSCRDLTEIITPGVEELVLKLKESGKTICLISGGFRRMILPIAKRLGIEAKNVFCNELIFREGKYIDFTPLKIYQPL